MKPTDLNSFPDIVTDAPYETKRPVSQLMDVTVPHCAIREVETNAKRDEQEASLFAGKRKKESIYVARGEAEEGFNCLRV